MFHSSMPRIFAFILAGLLLLLATLRADAAPVSFQPIAIYDFAAGRPANWSGTWCEWKSYGGAGDGASLLMLGGDACIAGPFTKTSIYQVQVLWSGYFVGGGGGGQYRVVILNEQYQLVQMGVTIEQSGGFSIQFPQSVGIEKFYVLFEHISGVSVHLDDVQIGWATQAATATPAPTSTPGATPTGTPAPTSTPAPTLTPTPTPAWEDVDSGYRCGGRGWFNWLLCWIVPPKDVFSSLQKLWDWLFNKDPFVTVKRLADMRQAMIAAVQSGGDVADISGWAAMVQRGFIWFFYDVLGQWRTVIQALFDAAAAIGFWRYVTFRLSI